MIVEAAREIFQVPDGVLHMSGVVTNNPALQLPVFSWEHFSFLTDLASARENFEGSRSSSKTEQYRVPATETPQADLVLVSTFTYHRVAIEC